MDVEDNLVWANMESDKREAFKPMRRRGSGK